MKKVWKLKAPSPQAETLSREAGLSLLMAELLIHRGIHESRQAQTFLSPRLSHLVPPSELKDMDRAVEMILRSIDSREKITIYGDFDADGLTATALLLNFFGSLDVPVSYYVPNRLTDAPGYGRYSYFIRPHQPGGLSYGPAAYLTGILTHQGFSQLSFDSCLFGCLPCGGLLLRFNHDCRDEVDTQGMTWLDL